MYVNFFFRCDSFEILIFTIKQGLYLWTFFPGLRHNSAPSSHSLVTASYHAQRHSLESAAAEDDTHDAQH